MRQIRGRAAGAAFEATSLVTLVQMVDNGLGLTLLPEMAVAAGITRGTSLVTRPLGPRVQSRRIGLLWRAGTRRRDEFRLLAHELRALAQGAARPGASA